MSDKSLFYKGFETATEKEDFIDLLDINTNCKYII